MHTRRPEIVNIAMKKYSYTPPSVPMFDAPTVGRERGVLFLHIGRHWYDIHPGQDQTDNTFHAEGKRTVQ